MYLLFLTDDRCCFCCQTNPGGRESDHPGNMGESEATWYTFYCCTLKTFSDLRWTIKTKRQQKKIRISDAEPVVWSYILYKKPDAYIAHNATHPQTFFYLF